MRYRYYKTDSPITDDVMPATGKRVYTPVGEVRCAAPYFSDHIMADCYGYVEYDTASGAYPPPVIMHNGWSPLYVVMDANDEQAWAREKKNGNSQLQQ